MNQNKTGNLRMKIYNLAGGKKKWLIVGGLLVCVAGLAMVLASNRASHEPAATSSTFKARRDNLVVTVTESGSIKARNSIELKSEVEGRATIINIVPEGTYITPEDVNEDKILVELDSGDLTEQLTQREIDFASAEASYAEAKEAYDIQVKQNESDISAAELKVKFALMDFQKYLGEALANQLIAMVDESNDPNTDIAALINFGEILSDPNKMGGEALQKLDELKNNIILAEERLERAKNTLDWTIRLREKEYVSETDLQSDQLNYNSLKIQLSQAKTDLDLFKTYDFSKQTQKLLSDYYEAKRALDRTYAKARSQLAQAKARLESAKARYDLQQDRLNKTKDQIAACIIKAPASGLVVYGSSNDPYRRFRGGNIIAAGEEVYQRQTIITLPDTSEMMAEITVHESSVDKVKPGQKATVVMDAFPDQIFHGEVIKVAPLPDQQRGWLSPDIKVYTTQVTIEGTHDFLKPGMSARVTILVDSVTDALIVPVQVVANRGGKKICFVARGGRFEEREVKTGQFNDTYVQILDGLQAGEDILLNPPRITETKTEPAGMLAGEFQRPGQQQPTQSQPTATPPGAPDPNRAGWQMAGMPRFDPNQLDEQTRERMRRFREQVERGEMPFDPNQFDEQTRERMRRFREQVERGEMPFGPNNLDEQTREKIRQSRPRRSEKSDGAASSQKP
jgi:HlyD family secretion protein